MRLWSLHPANLDRAALIAGWREGLLAQKVLAGQTKGYRHHPQLQRFREYPDPMLAIGAWLTGLYDDATRRGYNFDRSKILFLPQNLADIQIEVTDGQLAYEAGWLREKIGRRAPHLLSEEPWVDDSYSAHPIFVVVPGGVESWEKV
ncbi:pyrimidine dimer DNA glycosylase/endonuclease V [Arcanobacterium pinnipediorum]|uniref:Pyrimidine dimer DNA glycosylase/endonuclease V n=1 Tax=Arcanobacterium pinnipediorum TaxID=1503041 RepID=A0ABY5AKI2_9ACTO|nr:pyrimidine dimer DNA glycosylase/endonuclease V [Arcanobacterium pinnipediorum]USR79769.1 pyrimidine dimer DNA glycosylase/endonuclease V [Arcanobacterium pinnipediorum]